MDKDLKMLRHVGLIPDGGRRWARDNRRSLYDSYCQSMNLISDLLQVFYDSGLRSVSVYLLSKRNLRRSRNELIQFYDAANGFLQQEVPRLAEDYELDVAVAGDWSVIPRELAAGLRLVEKYSGAKQRLHLCVAYSPFDELRLLVRGESEVKSDADIFDQLWVKEPLDVVIRSGGAITLSEFLPLQAAYAQLVFFDELFNDTTVDEYLKILYSLREFSHSAAISTGGT